MYQTIPRVALADLRRALPGKPLYGAQSQVSASGVGWLLSPQPYALTASQVELLHRIGRSLHRFSQAIEMLYRASLKDSGLDWIRGLFQAGKPQHLLTFSQMNRFKQHLPLVIRPDLLVTPTGFKLCEIDAVPGGIGFTGALSQAYRSLGYPLVGSESSFSEAFLQMLLEAAPKDSPEPMIAVVVSDEASDYREEMAWLVNRVQSVYPNIVLLHPKELTLVHRALGFMTPQGEFQQIHILYRFFELFDLPNIPQIELIQYAVKKGLVFCTPPFKPYLEEKLVLALLHQPFLEQFWLKALGDDDFSLLKELIPEGWVLDPAPIPPHAQVVPELRFSGQHFRDFAALSELTQKQRELVIKPSGFSPLAWGSRGVTVGHDVSQNAWQKALQEAFSQFYTTPSILQRFEGTRVEPYTYFHPQSGEIQDGMGRTRLCPYYFLRNGEPELIGVLATTCPKDKKVIHGMRDGVMRPACLVDNLL